MRWRLRRRRSPGDGGDVELDARLSEAWEAGAAAVGTMLDLPAGKEALLASSGQVQEGTADLRPSAGPSREAVRRGRRRRLALRSVAAVAAALIAGAVALAAVGVPGAGHDGTEGPVVDAAYVVKRVDSALSAAGSGQIAQMTVTTTRSAALPGGATTTTTAQEWSYGSRWRSVTYSPARHLVYDEGSGSASVYTLVNYLTRTWARQPGLGRPTVLVPQGPGPRSCEPVVAALPLLFQPGLPGIDFPASSPPATVAAALRAAISCGTLTLAGQQRVDGIDAIELTSRLGSLISETIWVNPRTYLPVRVIVRLDAGLPATQRTVDITWLQPTARNLADLTVPIPAGFRQVPLAQAATPDLQQIPGGPLPAPKTPAAVLPSGQPPTSR